MRIDVRTDFARVERLLAGFPEKVVEQASARALNRAVDSGRTQMTRAITREFALGSAFVRERLRITRARASRGRLQLEATLAAEGRRSMNLIRFLEGSVTMAELRRRAKRGQQGRLFVKVKRNEPRKPLQQGAFIANRGRTIFVREGKARLPIKALSTINVPGMFNTRRLNRIVVEAMRDTWVRRFQYEAQRLINAA